MTKLVIMLSLVYDKLVIMLSSVDEKLVIMLSSVDDKTGNNDIFSGLQNW